MFTGIIAAVGKVAAIEPRGDDVRITIDAATLDLADSRIGDSIAVNGICLTAVTLAPPRFSADVSVETLKRTTLGEWRVGTPVNLELALRAADRLGGHLVSGHVDGIGELVSIAPAGRSQVFHFRLPPTLMRYVAEKGSICINGVSLTVNGVTADTFNVNIVPHTLSATDLANLTPGRSVNIEVDLLARYVERLLSADRTTDAAPISAAFLKEHGFLK